MDDAPDHHQPVRRDRIARTSEAALSIAIVPAAAMLVTAIVTFAWGCVKVWSFVELLFDDGADSSVAIVRLLEVIDLFLLGTVLLIFAAGMIELFITPLRLPDWLVITELGDLKAKLIDVIQLVVAIKFLEKLVLGKDALDVLWYGIAISLVIGALAAVRWSRSRSGH
ncbi:MAG: hypothetical protein RL238_1763 [Actinomycetota bacterium]|jgi:uncharacterized membrane protein YqhA